MTYLKGPMGMPNPAMTLSMEYGSSPRSTSMHAACSSASMGRLFTGTLRGFPSSGNTSITCILSNTSISHIYVLSNTLGRKGASIPYLCVWEENTIDRKSSAVVHQNGGLLDLAPKLEGVQHYLLVGKRKASESLLSA